MSTNYNYTFNLDCLFSKINSILEETPNYGETKIFMRPGSTTGTTLFHFKKNTVYGTVIAHVVADTTSAIVDMELEGYGKFFVATTDGEITVHNYDGEVDFCTKTFLDEFVRKMKLWFA